MLGFSRPAPGTPTSTDGYPAGDLGLGAGLSAGPAESSSAFGAPQRARLSAPGGSPLACLTRREKWWAVLKPERSAIAEIDSPVLASRVDAERDAALPEVGHRGGALLAAEAADQMRRHDVRAGKSATRPVDPQPGGAGVYEDELDVALGARPECPAGGIGDRPDAHPRGPQFGRHINLRQTKAHSSR